MVRESMGISAKQRRLSCVRAALSVAAAICEGMALASEGPAAGGVLDCRLWGKEKGLSREYPVICHLLDTAAVFLVLWDEVVGRGMRERFAAGMGLEVGQARAVGAFWAGLHDLGKITPPFQAQVGGLFARIKDEPEYLFALGADRLREFRHEMGTHWALAGLFAEAGYPCGTGSLKRAVSHQVAQMLGGHHGRYGAALKAKELAAASAYQPGLGEAGWAQQRRHHFTQIRRITGAEAVPNGGLPAELAVAMTGLVVVSDWLASQTHAIEPLIPTPGWQGTDVELDAHWERTRKAAGQLVADAQLGRARFEARDFQAMFPFVPNALQADISTHLPGLVAEHGSGLVLVTAPTGDGKTEAALFAAAELGRAAGARGIYFALPTMATANGMYPRVADFAAKALSGERALTLLHSMAWLNAAYNADRSNAPVGTEYGIDDHVTDDLDVSADHATAVAAGEWLRGSKRGLLAPLGTGTIDQALTAVLPVSFNALRLFGLSDKVFIVDEAHAYGPWMHKLLTRLLEWLGAFRAPVVLLSATLTGQTAASLVDAYRRGAGFPDATALQPRYPGWLFAATGGHVAEPRATGSERPRTLDIDVRTVVWDTDDGPEEDPRPRGRRHVLREVLAPVAREGGTALVCCTTVAEAQRTYRDLRAAFPDLAAGEGGLRLLHSRFPAGERQRITDACEAAYGKPRGASDTARPRPASILVATQVVEQSLDLDFDLAVSDLAPLAQLLQRAGRARRHARGAAGRPAWALPEDRPRLVVLEPVEEGQAGRPPRSWGAVYDPGLLRRTALVLDDCAEAGIAVPDDVQRLVDQVYADDFVHDLDAAAAREIRRLDAERQADHMAQEHLAELTGICAPADVDGNLYLLSRREAGITEELITTRLGADTGRVLCLYQQPSGLLTLDREGNTELPPPGKALSRDHVVQIMEHVTPVPGKWLRGEGDTVPAPASWEKQALLRDVVLLRMQADAEDPLVWQCAYGGSVITSSSEGLEQRGG